jgi:hypothetical protein
LADLLTCRPSSLPAYQSWAFPSYACRLAYP